MTHVEMRNEFSALTGAEYLDTALTARARGILFALTALPEGWAGHRSALIELTCPELNRHAFNTVIRELTTVGNLSIECGETSSARQLWCLHPTRRAAIRRTTRKAGAR